MVRHLYVHLPFCASRCGYCGFVVEVGALDRRDAYLAAVRSELAAERAGLGPLETVYLGGGTPTLMRPARIAALLDDLAPLLADGAEVSIEANPETVDAAAFGAAAPCRGHPRLAGRAVLPAGAAGGARPPGEPRPGSPGGRLRPGQRASGRSASICCSACPGRPPRSWRPTWPRCSRSRSTTSPGTSSRSSPRPPWRAWVPGFRTRTGPPMPTSRSWRGSSPQATGGMRPPTSPGPGTNAGTASPTGRRATTWAWASARSAPSTACAGATCTGLAAYLGQVGADGVPARTTEALDAATRRRERWMLGLRLDRPLDTAWAGPPDHPEAIARLEAGGLLTVGRRPRRAHPPRPLCSECGIARTDGVRMTTSPGSDAGGSPAGLSARQELILARRRRALHRQRHAGRMPPHRRHARHRLCALDGPLRAGPPGGARLPEPSAHLGRPRPHRPRLSVLRGPARAARWRRRSFRPTRSRPRSTSGEMRTEVEGALQRLADAISAADLAAGRGDRTGDQDRDHPPRRGAAAAAAAGDRRGDHLDRVGQQAHHRLRASGGLRAGGVGQGRVQRASDRHRRRRAHARCAPERHEPQRA